ncbi:MAG: Rho termination factor N-terminal domain-containing protein, partial [Pseudonocardiaceae bacterium]
MSDINVLGSEVAAAASSDQRPADRAGTAVPSSDNGAAPRRRGGLSGMVMAELRELAGQLGIPSIAGLRKNELIAAIKERQDTVPGQRRAVAEQLPLEGASAPTTSAPARTGTARRQQAPAETQTAAPAAEQPRAAVVDPVTPAGPGQSQPDPTPQPVQTQPVQIQPDRAQHDRDQHDGDADAADRSRNRRRRPVRGGGDAPRSPGDQNQVNQTQVNQTQVNQTHVNQTPMNPNQGDQAPAGQSGSQSAPALNGPRDDDDDAGRRRGRRFRDRNRRT